MNPKIVEVDPRAIPLLTAEEGGKSQAAAEQYFRLGDQAEAAVRTAGLSDLSGGRSAMRLQEYGHFYRHRSLSDLAREDAAQARALLAHLDLVDAEKEGEK